DSKENADFKLAINLFNDGLYDLAAEQLRQFVGAFPNTSQGIEARFYLGLTQMKLKRFEDARITFQTFALTYQDNPRAPEAWYNTGEAYASLKNFKEAAQAFERVKVFHPKSKSAPDALLQAAKYFILANDREDARRDLRVVLQEYPASPAVLSARTQLGKMYFEDGNLEQAQNELKRVIDGDPSADARAQALLILGNINAATRKSDQAQANYQEIIKTYKNSTAVQGAYVNLAKLFADNGRYQDAEENYRKALSIKSPTDSTLLRDAMMGVAKSEARQKDYKSAVVSYQRFLAAFPDEEKTPEALWALALTASRAKQYEVSNDACQKLLHSEKAELFRNRAMIRLARNAEDQQNLQSAVQAYQTFLDKNADSPSAPRVLYHIATIYDKHLKDFRKASAEFENLPSRYPQSRLADDALWAAGRCYEQMKDYNRALTLYRDLLERFPASDYYARADSEIASIEIFEAKDKDAGLERLALLVGDVVGAKDRIGLSYKLGDIYFSDLKNYQAAAAQFTDAINSGMTDDRFVNALYMRARSYEFLAQKDEKYRARAIDAYQTFLQTYNTDPRAKAATLALFFLRATSPANARAALTAAGESPFRDTMLFHTGELLEDADSNQSALDVFRDIIGSSTRSPSAREALYHSAVIYESAGLADSMIAAGEQYLALDPEGRHAAVLLHDLGAAELQRGKFSRAADLFGRLEEQFAYATVADDASSSLAASLMSAGKPDEALRFYTGLVRKEEADPLNDGGPDPALLLGLARAEQATGRIAEAKAHLFEILAGGPQQTLAGQAYMLLGMIAKGEGATETATAYFKEAEKASPGIAATRDVAMLLFENASYADAIRQFQALAQKTQDEADRRFYDSHVILARFRNNDVAGADRDIALFKSKYDKTDEEEGSFELERGSYFYRKENYANALKAFKDVANKFGDTPSAPTAQYWIAKSLQSLGKREEATKTLEELIKDHPDAEIIPRAHFALGTLYYDAEKWPLAIQHFRVVVDDPKPDPSLLPFAMNNLIETYQAAGVYDAALALTRKYLELYPNNDDSFDKKIDIGILYDRLGFYDQAVLHLQGLLDQAGSDLEGEIRYYIAEANYNKGDYQQAILDFLKVPYLVTKKGKIDWTANSLYMSGQSYEKMGRYDQALLMYKQIIDRSGIDETFKAAAKKEIDRVKLVLKKTPNAQ
ncbi:MAG: tetratricopeptide repeat protein, partial [Bacteroidota bacterium]